MDENLLFTMDEEQEVNDGPVTCLGITFENDEKRREYFREELRKKLPELRLMPGFPIGSDEDIIKLSDPPFYTACPNPWISQMVAIWESEKAELSAKGKRRDDFVVSVPFVEDISVGKNNPIYNAHSYHTKVPHPAIMKLLYHYTQPGDIVYDGFAGTGMTGIAAGMCGLDTSRDCNIGQRHAICNDLSPVASYISYNLNNNDSRELKDFYKILEELREEYSYIYNTKHTNGQEGNISYVVWSDYIICPNCGEEVRFWDAFVEYGKGNIKDSSQCPHCGSTIKRNTCSKCYETYFDNRLGEAVSRVKSDPILISYRYNGKKYTKTPDQHDIALYKEIEAASNSSWFPTNPVEDGFNLEQPRRSHCIYHIHQFYNPRTLFILSKIWERANERNYFCITNGISRNLTKLNRFVVNKYNPNGRINGPLTGTLYIPSEEVEQNVFDLLSEKQSDVSSIRFDNAIQTGDALHCNTVPDECVDYIFTDPPFGANIMYSELNVITESWLKVRTDNTDEAIENDHQHKSTTDYMRLMSDAFKDYYRILKPGKWMTVEFSNTKASVWNSIQTAIQSAGFVIAGVNALDKKHGGIKSMTFTTSVKEDLIITCYKPSKEIDEEIRYHSYDVKNVWDFIDDHLRHLPVHKQVGNSTTNIIERSPKILYDRLITYYVQKGQYVPLDASDFQKGLRERFVERDDMYFTPEQAVEYEDKKKDTSDFISMGLIVSCEADGIQWIKNQLNNKPQTYQELQPEWMQAINGIRKGDILPELSILLDENFIEDENGYWRIPNVEDDADKAKLRLKSLLREFKTYADAALLPQSKITAVRVEALRAGFKQCYLDKDFVTIIKIGDKIPQNLLTEDEVLLQYYDIASSRV